MTTGPSYCELSDLVEWVADLRAHGVTKVALGDFEATIDPLPIEPPKRDEGDIAERHDIDTMSGL